MDLLSKEYKDLGPLLDQFDYNRENERFTLKKDAIFRTNIDIKLRIQYYMISFLRRMEHAKTVSRRDDQMISSVLEDIAERQGDSWRLKQTGIL
ncbi:hypothetical protein FACS1894172_03890 [Spirochaetia bacterium]|nr:hypothetical protein FACS1894172_03890 [Spirochaetia bacterium]